MELKRMQGARRVEWEEKAKAAQEAKAEGD